MISVALACYNGEKYIREQIYSILNQKDVELEIIVCDDCSTDNTVNIVKEIQSKDSRISLYENEKQLGVVKNFEKAISICNGDYIALSDQDDVWDENKLNIQLSEFNKYIESNKPILIAHDLEVMNHDLKITEGAFWEKFKIKFRKNPFNFFLTNSLTGCTLFAQTKELKKVLPFEVCILHDHQIYIYYQVFGEIKPLYNKLIQFRRHETNVTTTFKFNLINRFFDIFSLSFLNNEKKYFRLFLNRYQHKLDSTYFSVKIIFAMPSFFRKLFHIIYSRCYA